MAFELREEVDRVSRIKSVPTILEVVCRTTGMGFAAVARVTEERWIACSVLDEIDFGLKAGGELKVETTICHEIRQSGEVVVIDNVAKDEIWCNHPTPATYGFQSYISVPIVLADGSFFGTLCAIDPRPARVKAAEVVGMFRLFADLIAKHLDADRQLAATESALSNERSLAELREQFIAMLGHDLRTPMRAITSFSQLLLRAPLDERAAKMAALIRNSALRMNGLIDNMLDLARGRLTGGLTLARNADERLGPVLEEVIAEMETSYRDRAIETEFALNEPIYCDRGRMSQLLCNLLGNALTYGSAEAPVRVRAISEGEEFELSVANAGAPIAPGVLPHLFEPFYRSGPVHAREGLGLGLYIAAEIAKAHGGTLGVTSSEIETCFTFRMPATDR